jgi:hypothetical protein
LTFVHGRLVDNLNHIRQAIQVGLRDGKIAGRQVN